MAEVVERKSGLVPAAVPPCVADVLLVVAFTGGGEVEGGVCGSAVKGEGLRICVWGYDAVDVVSREGLGDDVGVEGVKEVVCLVGKGRRGGGEVALGGEGEEHSCVVHYFDEGFVKVVLDRLDDAAHIGGKGSHLDDLGCGGVDRKDPAANLRYHEQNVFDHLRKRCPPFREAFNSIHHIAQARHEGKYTCQGDEYIVQNGIRIAQRIQQLHYLTYII